MRRKGILATLTSTIVLGLSVPASAQSLLEKIVATVLADRFGIQTGQIATLRTESRGSWEELTPAFSMGHYGNANAATVWKLRKSGLGWGQVAHKIGMHPGTFNKLRQQGAFDPKPTWEDILRRRFGAESSQVSVLQDRGAKIEDVLAAVVLSRLTGKTPQQMYDAYRSVSDWNAVASRSNVSLANWERVAKPVKWDAPAADAAPAAKEKGGPPAGKGKGKGKGKGGGGGG